MWDGVLRSMKSVAHRIDLEKMDSRPISSCSLSHRPENGRVRKTRNQSNALHGHYETCTNIVASPTVFVPKKDRTICICALYYKLIAVTFWDSSLIPGKDKCIDSLGNPTIFSTLNANSRSCQVDIDKKDRDKTSFSSHHGLFRFTRMLFGLKTPHRRFSERWTSYPHKSSGNLQFFIYTTSSYFRVHQTSTSIKFDNYRGYYTTLASH